MTNTFTPTTVSKSAGSDTQASNTFYAVYDCCITATTASRDVAFIEQRLGDGQSHQASDDEKYFASLSQAKSYVNSHFKAGAEYFSLSQSADPDNVVYLIIDKITYMMA